MSSIFKNSAVSFKEDDSYYIDPNKIVEIENSETKSRSLKDSLTNSLNDLEAKIKVANREYDNIMKKCETKLKETDYVIESLKKEAYDDAFNRGYNDGKRDLENEYTNLENNLRQEFNNKTTEFENEKVDFVNRIRDSVTEAIVLAVQDIIKEDVKNDKTKMSIIDILVLRGLSMLTDEKEVKVFLSNDDYKNLNKEEVINKLGHISYELSFAAKKELNPTECMLETNLGYVDVSLNNLLNSISTFVKGKIN